MKLKQQDFLLFRLSMGHARERSQGCLRNVGLRPRKSGQELGLIAALWALGVLWKGGRHRPQVHRAPEGRCPGRVPGEMVPPGPLLVFLLLISSSLRGLSLLSFIVLIFR